MSAFNSFLGTILPDMGSEHFSATGEHDMSTSVMGSQLASTVLIDRNVNIGALGQAVRKFAVKDV